MKVKCAVCGRLYEAKIPKGGDGTLWIPRRHYRIFPNKKIRDICLGSLQEGELIEDKEDE